LPLTKKATDSGPWPEILAEFSIKQKGHGTLSVPWPLSADLAYLDAGTLREGIPETPAKSVPMGAFSFMMMSVL
jgi:hypothetical protein